MPVYRTPDKKLISSIESYVKGREEILISNTIEFKNILFAEAVFYKKGFFRRSKEVNGYSYVILENKENEKVCIEDLCKLAYYNCAFLCTMDEGGILDAFRNSVTKNNGKTDMNTLYSGIDYLQGIGYDDAEDVKDLVEQLETLTSLNVDMFTDIDNIRDLVLNEKKTFSLELKDELYDQYIKTLKLNYEKVKLIESYYECLVKIQEIVDEKMSMFRSKLLHNGKDVGIVAPIRKLKSEVDYFIRVIEIYDKILKMSEEEYLDYVNELDSKRIKQRLELIRK